MLQKTTFQFLKELNNNNNKIWFDENRKKYETAKENFHLFVDELIKGIALFDAPIGELIAKKCTFRINKDIRFSKDKTPYKTNMAASFTIGGKKVEGAGYYFHLEPNKSFVAGGNYMPMPPDLTKIRQEIDYNFDSWKKIISNKNFITHFPMGVEGTQPLTRPPKGYDINNPAIEFLKMKGYIVSHPISDSDLMDNKTIKNILKSFEAMKPMIDFIRHAMSE